MENKAAFSLERYHFSKVIIDLENKESNDLEISFKPSGIFMKENNEFNLNIIFYAHTSKTESPFVTVECVASFVFENVNSIDEIPNYFYRNSIAIIFPYIRAFISTVTLQANIPPVILPTMNLMSLEVPLRENTTQR